MTEDDIRARLTQEVERLLGENARLLKEKQEDVGVWLRAERDYRDKIEKLTARVRELENGLSGVLWMAEEWFEHGGDETTLADDYEKQLEAARALLTPTSNGQKGGE